MLEREQAIGVGGAGRELLEQRVGAANAAAAALQNRLSLLERAHERKQEALQKAVTRASEDAIEDVEEIEDLMEEGQYLTVGELRNEVIEDALEEIEEEDIEMKIEKVRARDLAHVHVRRSLLCLDSSA